MAITIPIVSTYDSKGLDSAARDIKKAEGGWNKAGVAIQKAAAPAAATIVVMAAAGVAAVKLASDQEQAFGGLDTVFKDQATTMQSWAKEQDKVGLSATQAASAATLLGSQLKNLGADTATAATQSQELVGLGGDLAATFGGPTVDAVDALSAAFKGEYDSLEKYGVSLKASDVSARLAAEGQDKLTGEAKKAAEAAAINAILWEQTTDAQGQAGREAGTTAGQMATLTAKVKNAGASFGEALLPAAEKFLSVAVKVADWISSNQTAFLALATVVGTLAAAILVINAAMKVWAAISAVVAAANYVLGTSFTVALGPIALVIAAILAVIAVGILIYKNWDKISAFLKKVWAGIKKAGIAVFRAIGNAIKLYFTLYKRVITAVWNAIKAVITGVLRGLKSAITTYLNAYKAVFTAVWRAIKAVVTTYIRAVQAVVKTVMSAIKAAVRTTMNAVKAIMRGDWRAVLAIVRSAISSLISLVRSIPGKIKSAIGNLGSLLYNAGRQLIQGLINGIKSLLGSLGGIAGSILDKVNPFASLSTTPSSVSLLGDTRASTRNQSTTVNMTINARDPYVAARVMKRASEGYDVSQGRGRGTPLAVAW